MRMKYVRMSELGFILWPALDQNGDNNLHHRHVAHLARMRGAGGVVSAGFVSIEKGKVVCGGASETLDCGAHPSDSEDLAKQLGLNW